MSLLTEWIKPNGVRVELNDEEATVEMARKLKWVPFSETEGGLAEAKVILAEKERRAQATVDAAAKTKQAADAAAEKQRLNAEKEAEREAKKLAAAELKAAKEAEKLAKGQAA